MPFRGVFGSPFIVGLVTTVACAQPLPRMPGWFFAPTEIRESTCEIRSVVESTLPFQPVPLRAKTTSRMETPSLGFVGGGWLFSRSIRLEEGGEDVPVRDLSIPAAPPQWIQYRNDVRNPIDPPDPDVLNMFPSIVRPGQTVITDFVVCMDHHVGFSRRKPGKYRIEFPRGNGSRSSLYAVEVVVREPENDDAEVYSVLTRSRMLGAALSDPWRTVSRENATDLRKLLERFPQTGYADDLRYLAARSVILSGRPMAEHIAEALPDADDSLAESLRLLAAIDLRRYPFAAESLIVARYGYLMNRDHENAEKVERTLLELFPRSRATFGLMTHLVDHRWLSRLYATRIDGALAGVRDKDPMIRFSSIRTVDRVDMDHAQPLLPALNDALDDEDPRVRLMAAIVLLRKKLQDDKWRRDAAAVLHHDGVLQTDPKAPEAHLRRYAIQHLSLCGPHANRSVPLLLPILDQPVSLRLDVLRTFQELGPHAAAAESRLKEMAADPEIQKDAATLQLVTRILRNIKRR